jgi:hypothetical protein
MPALARGRTPCRARGDVLASSPALRGRRGCSALEREGARTREKGALSRATVTVPRAG